MSLMQIGVLLEIIGTLVITLVASVLLAPEIIGPRVPSKITHILKEFASKLYDLVPEQFASQIKGLKKGIIGPIFWLLVILSTFFIVLANRISNNLILIIGIIMGASAVFLFGWIISLPALSLKATIQRGTWNKGKFTPTQPPRTVQIGLLSRLRFAVLLLMAVLFTGLFWIVALIPLTLSIIWRLVTQSLTSERAPRIIALLIGAMTLIAGLLLEFIGSLNI